MAHIEALDSSGRLVEAEHCCEQTADGSRGFTRNPEGYFRMMADFIRDGRLREGVEYGATVSARARQPWVR